MKPITKNRINFDLTKLSRLMRIRLLKNYYTQKFTHLNRSYYFQLQNFIINFLYVKYFQS